MGRLENITKVTKSKQFPVKRLLVCRKEFNEIEKKLEMKYYIEIPEVHKALVKIELPEKATRDQIIEEAQNIFEDSGSIDLEYSHTLENDKWVIRTEKGDFLR